MKKLGFHYFPDTKHYRQRDLEIWRPRLKKMGASWLTLIAPETRAIPEPFLRGLIISDITPILHFPIRPDQIPNQENFKLLFRTYARWGINHVILFEAPNKRANWGNISWAKTDLVERFLDLYLPIAEEALKAELQPIFPPLEQGGDYWDLTFLRTFLESLQRRGHNQLLDKLILSVNANPNGNPLTWGMGGPERWPGARPYFTPPGTEDHQGFRNVDWYTAISQAVLGKNIPIFMLMLGGKGPQKKKSKQIKKIIRVLDNKVVENHEPLPQEVVAGMFWLLAAEEESKPISQAWYATNGTPHSFVEEIATITAPPQKKGKPTFHIEHYLLLPTYDGKVNDWHLEIVRGFVKKNQPTVGFSLAEAIHAKRVTVIGGTGSFSSTDVDNLRAHGCVVRQINGDGTEIASQLNRLQNIDTP